VIVLGLHMLGIIRVPFWTTICAWDVVAGTRAGLPDFVRGGLSLLRAGRRVSAMLGRSSRLL